ncbi:MAG: YezD family protein [Treponema sp.]|nr:YezD family protein [Treponema sp.]
MIENPTKQNIINIAERLYENAAKIRYGSISTTLKIHDGRVVGVFHSTTENTKEQEKK